MNEQEQADLDLSLYGESFMVDGKRVDPRRVTVRSAMRGRAQEEEPRVRHVCNMGVGCEETGFCYAAAHGQPEQCGRPIDAPDSKR